MDFKANQIRKANHNYARFKNNDINQKSNEINAASILNRYK